MKQNHANVGNKPKKCNFIYQTTISLWKVHMCWQIEKYSAMDYVMSTHI